MHSHSINASLQLIPITDAAIAMPQIDKAILLIRSSGLSFEVGPFGTSVEGPYKTVMSLVDAINNMMVESSQAEWVLNIQLHIKPGSGVTMQEKTGKHR